MMPEPPRREMRILIADRHAVVRLAVKTFLQNKLELQGITEASDSQELLTQIQCAPPEIVVLEWELPGGPATELLATLRALDARPKVIVLGRNPEQGQDALAAGADYFVSKADPPKRLLTAVRIIQAEEGYA